jgi:hypothetical protein
MLIRIRWIRPSQNNTAITDCERIVGLSLAKNSNRPLVTDLWGLISVMMDKRRQMRMMGMVRNMLHR